MFKKLSNIPPVFRFSPFLRFQSSQHALEVKKKIEDTRDKAHQAGGQRRIDAQHKKVIFCVKSLLIIVRCML